eukprot:TRINITY_DN5517_c0_g1_i1.p1 TRINITY_DN5517_c0_g1~~TRINITY_DN5517_c0_g1_i1.p1  ORF type:complete len:266 (-),score=31.63 TRINITY_DN5517_c0_g1_i1:8-781(-)
MGLLVWLRGKWIPILLILLGLSFVAVIALWLPIYLEDQDNESTQKWLTVSDYSDPDYYDWKTDSDPNDSYFQYTYTLFNIENIDQIRSGANMPYQCLEKGPYSFRQHCTKYSVLFEDEGKYQNYVEHCWFEDQNSDSNLWTDIITTINPGYETIITLWGEYWLDSILNEICYTIPTYYGTPDCNEIGKSYVDSEGNSQTLTMYDMFGITFPEVNPGNLAQLFFLNSPTFVPGVGGGSGLLVSRKASEWLFAVTRTLR